jgi:WhiB family redox-sensing transcriptional regulator
MSEALFGVDSSVLDWQQQGLCKRYQPEVFYSPDGERGAPKARREAAAKAICSRCKVVDACLQWALDQREEGIWGGTTDKERKRMLQIAKSLAEDTAPAEQPTA